MANQKLTIDEFIRRYNDKLNFAVIERELNIPATTLNKVNEGRLVPKKYRVLLISYFKNWSKIIINE